MMEHETILSLLNSVRAKVGTEYPSSLETPTKVSRGKWLEFLQLVVKWSEG